MKKIILHSFAIIIYFLLSACSGSASFPTATPNPSATYTPIPSIVPSLSPKSSTPQVPGLVKTTLEFYRGEKTYEIIVGYDVGNAFFYATPRPEFPSEKWDKAGANSAEFERYGDFDSDGETEYIVSLMYCGAYCSESIQIYDYDMATDSYYVADEFGAKYPAVDNYTDLNNDGNPEIITANYGFCYQCGGAMAALATLSVLRYESGKFIDVSSEFPELLLEEASNFLELAKALVHKSKKWCNPSIGRRWLGDFVTLRHTQVCHPIESSAANYCLCGLCFKQTSGESVAKDRFQAKHGSLGK